MFSEENFTISGMIKWKRPYHRNIADKSLRGPPREKESTKIEK